MSTALHIAEDGFTLPLELAARTQAILAMKGAGKTYTAMRETEEMLRAGVQVVALDPTGVWWGLRSEGKGKDGRAFDVLVLGGEHGDAPLEPTGGAVVADFAVKSGRSILLDLSGFESNAAQDRFATDFAERLYRQKASDRATLHLMVDEADSFAPQRAMPGQQRMLGAFEAIARRGRSRGLGLTLISQRPAVLNKNVLSQVDLLICGRVVGPHDHKALTDWASLYATAPQLDQFTSTLPKLETGEVWCWSPEWLGVFRRVKISRRVSFDSSSTPAPGATRPAAKMVGVDLAGLTREMQATIESAQANDPRALKRELAGVRAELETLQRAAKDAPVKEKRVEVSVLTGKERELLIRALSACEAMTTALSRFEKFYAVAVPPKVAELPIPAPIASPRSKPLSGEAKFGKAERSILTVLAQYAPAAVGKSRVALIAGYSVNGGGFNNPLSKLRTQGMVIGSDPLQITSAGLQVLGEVPPLPTGRALLDHWCGELGKAEGLILRALAAQGGRVTKPLLAQLTGYAVDGGGFNNPLSKLRTLQLISGSQELQLAEDLR